jgi:saccharopepsin
MEAQIRGLSQKYLGARPDTHMQSMFQQGPVEADKYHPVPITNFMNAQCK